jgi:hypothetical protein
MAVYVKTAGGWTEVTNTAPNIRVKTGASTWTEASIVYVKNASGWQVVWDNAATPPLYSSSSTAAAGAGSPDKSSYTLNWTQPTVYSFNRYEFTSDGGTTWGSPSTNAALRAYTWTNLDSSTSYTFGVRVVTNSGRTGELLRTDTTANGNPQPVTSLSSSGITPTQADISWTASTSTDLAASNRYEIWASGATSATFSQNGTSKTITGLTQNTSYTYTVYAVDSGGLKSSGVSVTFTTTNANPPAPTVSGLSKQDDGTSRTTTAAVQKGLTFSVSYSGEAVSAVAELRNSANTQTLQTVTLYGTGNRQTSINQNVSFTGLSESTSYICRVVVTDANSGSTTTDSAAYTTNAAYEYERTASDNWTVADVPLTQDRGPSALAMRASSSVSGRSANSVFSPNGGWVSGSNTASESGTSYEYIAWPFDWSWSGVDRYITYYTRPAGGSLVTNTVQNRFICGFRYSIWVNASIKDIKMYVSLGRGYTTSVNATDWSNNGAVLGTIPYGGGNGYNTAYTYYAQNNSTGDGGGDPNEIDHLPSAYFFPTQAYEWEGSGLLIKFTGTRLSTHTGGYSYSTGFRQTCTGMAVKMLYRSSVTETPYYR